MIDIFLRGGIVMYPLLLAALLGIAFIFERFIVLSRIPSPKKAERELETVENLLRDEGEEAVAIHCTKGRGILNYIYSSLLKRYDAMMIERREVASRKKEIFGETKDEYGLADFLSKQQDMSEMREELIVEVDESAGAYLGKWFTVIGTIGTVSPLLGLLGTIVGMIQAFDSIAKAGTGDPRVVAAGISMALITTATGLVIAIPAIVFHKYLMKKADTSRNKIEIYAHAFANTLMAHGAKEVL